MANLIATINNSVATSLCFAWTYDTTAPDGSCQERPKNFIRSRNAFFQTSFKPTKHGKRSRAQILCSRQIFVEDERLGNIILTVSQSLHKESSPRIHQRNTTEGFEHTSPPKQTPRKRPRKADHIPPNLSKYTSDSSEVALCILRLGQQRNPLRSASCGCERRPAFRAAEAYDSISSQYVSLLLERSGSRIKQMSFGMFVIQELSTISFIWMFSGMTVDNERRC